MHAYRVQHERVVRTIVVLVGTVLILAIGNLAGLGPPEWPSLHSLLSTSERMGPAPRPACKNPGLIGNAECPTHRHSGTPGSRR